MKTKETSYNYTRGVNRLKTILIFKLKRQYDMQVLAIRKVRMDMLKLPRRKDGQVYKRYQQEFLDLQSMKAAAKYDLQCISNKYWKLRAQEKALGLDYTASALFSVWNNAVRL